jgi:hypothetical protein
MQKLQPIAQEIQGLGYSITTQVISLSAWRTALADQEHGLVGKPVPFAWCPRTHAELARRGIDTGDHADITAAPIDVFEPDYGSTSDTVEFSPDDTDQAAPDNRHIESESMILSRQVTIPTSSGTDGPDVILDNVYHLVTDPEFVTARSRMYAHLAAMAAGAVPEDEIVDRLQAAAAAYDAKVAEYNKAGVRRTIHQVVPTAANSAAKLLGVPIPGTGWIVRRVFARYDPLPPHPAALGEPGAALSMAPRVLPRVHTDGSTLAAAALRTATYR